jgi:hypothetical protein
MGYHEGDKVWLYCLTCMKLQSLSVRWYQVLRRINQVVHRIQRNPRSKVVIHLDISWGGITERTKT